MIKEILDVHEKNIGQHETGHGKNYDALIAAGSWVISGFNYGSSKCACCGRPIVRILKLKNTSHDFASSKDPNYAFPEEIGIGVVCGPKVFKESCAGFYENPSREWERQHAVWKTYIKYVIACTLHKETWEATPVELRSKIDDYLEEGGKGDPHSGKWWVVRDAKRILLERVRIDENKQPNLRDLRWRLGQLIWAAKSVEIIPRSWSLNKDTTFKTI
jgi:hypothetical protein